MELRRRQKLQLELLRICHFIAVWGVNRYLDSLSVVHILTTSRKKVAFAIHKFPDLHHSGLEVYS